MTTIIAIITTFARMTGTMYLEYHLRKEKQRMVQWDHGKYGHQRSEH